ncbi:MAG TPA: hypothetical protein VFM15_08815 [Gammaproteobacteria bacterium]|nr:hypothetical protein [Gammaproteobacteria bacterium]
MKAPSLMRAAICLPALLALAGCATGVSVKSILANPDDQLASAFTPANLSANARDTVKNADSTPLGFHKMVINLHWDLIDNDKTKTVQLEQQRTFVNAGGSFVQSIIRDSRNGVPTSTQFDLTYRGLVTLRSQQFLASSVRIPLAMATHKFTSFTPIGNGNNLDYAYTYGYAGQWAGFRDERKTCTQGKPYPASKIFATLQGQARDIECTTYNNNNVTTGTRGYAYLEHYGIALYLHAKLADGDSDAKVTSVTVQ